MRIGHGQLEDCLRTIRIQNILEHFLPAVLQHRSVIPQNPLFHSFKVNGRRHHAGADPLLETVIPAFEKSANRVVLVKPLSDEKAPGKRVHPSDVGVEEVDRIIPTPSHFRVKIQSSGAEATTSSCSNELPASVA